MNLKKKIGTAVASVALVGAGSMAFAYWTSTGSGSGTASTGSAAAVTIVQTSSVSDLGPGGAPQALSGTFDVDHPVYVGQVSVDDVSTDKAGCDADDFATTDPSATNSEIEDGDGWSGGSIVFVSKPDANQDACQGATVTISYVSN